MENHVTFYGPIAFYVRRESDEWSAYTDPFATSGDGPTQEAAIEDAAHNLIEFLRVLSEEAREHGDEVETSYPLPDEFKEHAEVSPRLIFAIHRHEQASAEVPEVRPLSGKYVREVFVDSAQVGVVPPLRPVS